MHCNWVVIKVAFGSVKKHAVRHDRSRRDLPHYKREIYLGPSSDSDQEMHGHARLRVNQVFQITGSRKSGRL